MVCSIWGVSLVFSTCYWDYVSEQYLHCKAGIANGNWTHLAFFNDFQLFKRKWNSGRVLLWLHYTVCLLIQDTVLIKISPYKLNKKICCLPVRFLDILSCVHIYHMNSHNGMWYTDVRFKFVSTMDSNRENVAIIRSFLYNFYCLLCVRIYVEVPGKEQT